MPPSTGSERPAPGPVVVERGEAVRDQVERLRQAAADADRDGRAVLGSRTAPISTSTPPQPARPRHPPPIRSAALAHPSRVGQVQRDAADPGLVGDVVDLDDDRVADPLGAPRLPRPGAQRSART
jgi:hypothetical protein